MDEVKVYYDQEGQTLTVWFGNPKDEYICEETGEEIILMKNMSGQVIGFEKLHYVLPQPADFRVMVETIAVAA
jgi:uncharacterized protein YuzE